MVRDLNKEAQKIRNGNRFVKEVDGTGVFSRDADRLLNEYTNLRKKLYSTYSGSFSDQATREELRSYIDEQFVKLVKEYDINSPVDFPGYIDKKLKLRVKQTFVKNQYRDKGREKLLSREDGIDILLDEQEYDELQEEDMTILNDIFSGVDFSEPETFIIKSWLTSPVTDARLTQQVSKEYSVTKREADVMLKNLKDFVRIKLEDIAKE